MTTTPAEPTALYRLFNAEGALLYIGITNNPEVRQRTHSQTKPWWPDVATASIEWFADRTTAAIAEARAIRQEGPRWNVALPDPEDPFRHGGGTGAGGRPATGKTPVVTFRVDPDLRQQFDATVEEGRSRSDVLIELMHERVTKKERERAAAERVARDGDPDTRCGDAHRPDPQSTSPRSVARCVRGLGHPGDHMGSDFDGTQQYQWPQRPAVSEEKTT